MGPNLNIFAIYTSEDKEILLHLLNDLKPFEKDSNVTIWDSDPILPEQAWKPKNESRLNKTDIFLLLVSDAFMHSQFIQQLEFKTVIDLYKEGKSTVIPIIIDKCPWDIDFRSDDYNFNLNELGVFPKEGKPIKEWDSSEKVYSEVAAGIEAVITSLLGGSVLKESKVDKEEEVKTAKTEEQIALSFNEEKEAEEEKRRKEEVEAKRITEENRGKEQTEAENRVEEEQRIKAEVESKRRAEEQKLKDQAETRRLEREKRLKEEAESKRRTEEQRLKEEVEVKRRAEQERRREEENQQKVEVKPTEAEEIQPAKGIDLKKGIRVGLLVVLLAIIGIWAFSKFSKGSVKQPSDIKASDTITVKDSIVSGEIEINTQKEEVLSILGLGDTYEDGFVFEIASDGKTGKIAHFDDAGPMTWKNAMQIHEQLGEGWRLPTFDELRLMQKTIGPGSTNDGEFSNGLYWSATDYDEYQARLLRFRDGNRSYHYNKEAEHRKFRVRAIRNFSR